MYKRNWQSGARIPCAFAFVVGVDSALDVGGVTGVQGVVCAAHDIYVEHKPHLQWAHRKADAAFFCVDVRHPDGYNLAHADHIERVSNKLVTQARDVNEAIVF